MRNVKLRASLLGVLGLGLLILVWQLIITWLSSSVGLASALSPLATLDSLIYLLQEPSLWGHVGASLLRVFVGLLGAIIIGVPIGFVVGASSSMAQLTGPAFQFLRMISPLSWMPVVVMILGIGNTPIYFLLTFAAVWPMILNTAAGVKSINPQWLELGRSLCATPTEMLFKIMLPAVFEHILTGLRLAIGIVWGVLVPCEMLGVNEGLGYFILDTRDRLAYSELMGAIILIGLIGWGLDSFTRYLNVYWKHNN